jgi:hypothetical protein
VGGDAEAGAPDGNAGSAKMPEVAGPVSFAKALEAEGLRLFLDEQPGVGAVHLMSAIEKEFGRDVTTRTWNTILRIIKAGNR